MSYFNVQNKLQVRNINQLDFKHELSLLSNAFRFWKLVIHPAAFQSIAGLRPLF